MRPEARTRAQRRRDTEHRLAHDVDLWVASASADGTPKSEPDPVRDDDEVARQ